MFAKPCILWRRSTPAKCSSLWSGKANPSYILCLFALTHASHVTCFLLNRGDTSSCSSLSAKTSRSAGILTNLSFIYTYASLSPSCRLSSIQAY